jgi:hypothetical protein
MKAHIQGRKLRRRLARSTGPAYQVTEFIRVEADQDSRTRLGTAILGSILEKVLTRHAKFELAYELTVAQESSGGLLHHSTNTLETAVTKTVDLDLVFTWDGSRRPKPLPTELLLSRTIPVSA